MSANASEDPIKLTDDGKYVIMPVEVFRNREIDLLELEDKVKVLEKALAEERQAYDEWQAEFNQLAEALNVEREAYHQLEMANLKDKITWGLGGILIGAVIALAVD
jgi:molecular chaperone GrpE (heat shock protein)